MAVKEVFTPDKTTNKEKAQHAAESLCLAKNKQKCLCGPFGGTLRCKANRLASLSQLWDRMPRAWMRSAQRAKEPPTLRDKVLRGIEENSPTNSFDKIASSPFDDWIPPPVTAATRYLLF